MSMIQILRRKNHQPPVERLPPPRYAPGWLAEQQRSTLRMLAGGLVVSLGMNCWQFYLREQIPLREPEVFAALMSPDLTVVKVVAADRLAESDFELLAMARVKEFVYWLRRVETQAQVDEATRMIGCSVTGKAEALAKQHIRESNFPLVEQEGTRFLTMDGIKVAIGMGASREGDTIEVLASWVEHEKVRGKNTVVPREGFFRVERFAKVSSELRNCNIGGMLVTGYRLP